MKALLHVIMATLVATAACKDDSGVSANNQTESGNGGGTAATSVGSGGLYEPPGPVAGCSELCTQVAASCSGANVQYGSQASCEAVCSNFPEGMSDDDSGNTRGCRAHYAELAAQDSAHCIHAGPAGTAPSAQIGDTIYCGGACENFCTLAAALCTSTYASVTDCLLECSSFDASEPYSANATTGFACRMAELSEASLAPARCANIVAASPTCN